MPDDRPFARELGDFLKARRSRLTPEAAGFAPGPRRKVAGLRREELALLAGLSTDYYQRMEQGRDVRPSDDVLDALARALTLDDDERRHFFALAHAARRPSATRPRRTTERVPDSTRRLLHSMGCPGVVLGRHLDVLAWNDLAEALLGDPRVIPPAERNMLLLLFRDPETRARCPEFESTALDYIGMLRKAVGQDPTHPRALAVVGELSIRSAEFRRLWARHDVTETTHGTKLFAHPRVGMITLDWDAYPLPGARGPVLVAYTAEPGTPDADKLRLLADLHAAATGEGGSCIN
ncbi:transcriptional regulator [Virgisporangium aliadipatigenens]|uniref:Transcriptional regulator n=1 Tax=Virgisporangium aliadipatigenens TaxID=741659 RepID=A0A8J3YJM7_9ACTN|nr:helix-turn-helix transcriptional regulator [Virgisporangium aliadipatigenens]GIJ45245.1 transcriptional regulator [Virgisporangium aliadipatigenens]